LRNPAGIDMFFDAAQQHEKTQPQQMDFAVSASTSVRVE
jgi:hypothetical protein